MIELRPTEVVKGVEPRPKILLVNHWVQFSPNFPSGLDHVGGKAFRIAKQQQVTYELSWIVKELCYRDIDLSNETGENLYPDVSNHLYEMLIGFKPGNYLCQVYFPADYPIYRLDDPDMSPLISDSAKKYLGAIKPSDSPVGNETFKFYAVYKLKPLILRLLADNGIDYEKIGLHFTINRCLIEQGTPPPHIEPKPILYLNEIAWLGAGA